MAGDFLHFYTLWATRGFSSFPTRVAGGRGSKGLPLAGEKISGCRDLVRCELRIERYGEFSIACLMKGGYHDFSGIWLWYGVDQYL